MKLQLPKRLRSTDAVQRDTDDNALMEAYRAAIARATTAAAEYHAADIVYNEVRETAARQVTAAGEKGFNACVESQLAGAAVNLTQQKVRSSDAVDRLVREDGPVLPMLCKTLGHIQQHLHPITIAQDREELRDLQKAGFKPGMSYPSGVVVPGSITVGRLEHEIPLADWSENHHPAFMLAAEAVRALQLVRGVDFHAAVTAILKTLPQRCDCGHTFALEVPTSNAAVAA